MATKKAKAEGEIVQITVRLPKDKWKKLAYLAIDEDTSVQAMLSAAVDKILKAKGRE